MPGEFHRVRKRRVQQQLGLTLIEVMIAAGILAVGMVMALGSIISIAATTAQSEERAMGAAVVSSVIEQIRATASDDVRDFDPADVVGGRIQPEAWVVTPNGEVALPAEPDVPDAFFLPPMQLRVRASWVDLGGRAYAVETSTIVGD